VGHDGAWVCVLASSSGGNCSVLRVSHGGRVRIILVDLGLSPRRVRLLLAESGINAAHIDAAIVTHLDSDHWCPAWGDRLGDRVYVHDEHKRRGVLTGLLSGKERAFDRPFEIVEGVRILPHMVAHDEAGATSLRIEIEGVGSLGWATDVGQVNDDLVGHLKGVGVLAIESNYCPEMQERSNRPHWLKKRIMGGYGHLSNAESADAVRRIIPRSHTILLHLSRQCNTPSRAARAHAGCPTPLIISSHDRPTPWVGVGDTRDDIPRAVVVTPGIRFRSNG
jgi:phosphoribosyl 1,2-cyclic phosphodiesterase